MNKEEIKKILKSNNLKCRRSVIQEYGCMVCVRPPWESSHKWIGFDMCLAKELFYLWDLGIITTGSCCGCHTYENEKVENGERSYIGVTEEFIPKMKELGYEVRVNTCDPTREDSFVPKTNFKNL